MMGSFAGIGAGLGTSVAGPPGALGGAVGGAVTGYYANKALDYAMKQGIDSGAEYLHQQYPIVTKDEFQLLLSIGVAAKGGKGAVKKLVTDIAKAGGPLKFVKQTASSFKESAKAATTKLAEDMASMGLDGKMHGPQFAFAEAAAGAGTSTAAKAATKEATKEFTKEASKQATAEASSSRAHIKKPVLAAKQELKETIIQKAKESDFPTSLKGEMGERMAEYMFKYLEGYELMPTKYSGNRGIDIMAVKYDASGVVERIMIVECKFSKNGKLKLGKANSEYNRGRKMEQLSDCWLLEQMENPIFIDKNPESYSILFSNKDKIYFKASVTDPSGRTRWIDGGKYSEDAAKNSLENLIIKANKKKKK